MKHYDLGFGTTDDHVEELNYHRERGDLISLASYWVYLLNDTADRKLTNELVRTYPQILLTRDYVATPEWIDITLPDCTIRLWNLYKIPMLDYGDIYGYPKCCQEWFDRRTDSIMSGHSADAGLGFQALDGTGYLACPKCRTKTAEEQIAAIMENRIIPLPFPQDECEPFVLTEHVLRLGRELGENLKEHKAKYPDFNKSILLPYGENHGIRIIFK
ncbi:hypothetical protein pEaSNUABM54_00120 [Erwinia phage pEa_SNUABM_54]|nr:hypothetical protein pEaSNUABM54_00120 [Erwinia phage pEa_SNUABM_54]